MHGVLGRVVLGPFGGILAHLQCLLWSSHLLLLRRLLHLLLEFLDTGLDPRVAEGILGRHTLIGLPLQALVDEVYEVDLAVVSLHHLGQVLRTYVSHLTLRVGLL